MTRAQPHTRALAQGIPLAVRAVAKTLSDGDFEAWLSGTCVTRWLRGERPDQYEVITTAPPSEITERIAHAVPIRPDTINVPTAAGPVDVVSSQDLLLTLSRKDFTLHAIAYDVASDELVDPSHGVEDLANHRLRSVASAEDCMKQDAVRGLRAVRLVATHGLSLDPSLLAALPSSCRALGSAVPERVRYEITRLLLADAVREGLALLRESGIEQVLAPDVQDDAAAVVAALPVDLELRLAGWLRNANATRCLRRMRVSKPSAQRVVRLIQLHPVGADLALERFAPVARLLRRNSAADIDALLTLRAAEIDTLDEGVAKQAEREQWEALTNTIDQVRAKLEHIQSADTLAVDGAVIMQALNWPPGPDVGRALRYLVDCVARDPACNERSTLLALLKDWKSE